VNLGVSRDLGAPVQLFDVQRNYSSSVLGRSISEHQEVQLEHCLVRNASSSLFSQLDTSAHASALALPPSPITLPHNKSSLSSTAALSSPAQVLIVPEIKKHPAAASLAPHAADVPSTKPSPHGSWSELKEEQLQRATRCCCELLQLHAHRSRQIDALEALCRQQQQQQQQQQRALEAAKVRLPSPRFACSAACEVWR
jgi:hypothetical protein